MSALTLPLSMEDYQKLFANDKEVSLKKFNIGYDFCKELKEKQSSFNYSLNGSWKFHYATGFNQLIPEFSNKDDCVDHWDEIKVPGHIQLQGH